MTLRHLILLLFILLLTPFATTAKPESPKKKAKTEQKATSKDKKKKDKSGNKIAKNDKKSTKKDTKSTAKSSKKTAKKDTKKAGKKSSEQLSKTNKKDKKSSKKAPKTDKKDPKNDKKTDKAKPQTGRSDKNNDRERPDLDEFQSPKLENAKNPFAKSNEFTINFAGYKDADWCYPLKGAKVISPYGGKRRHGGTDLKTFAGDNIYAAFEGRVITSGVHFGYGNCVIIRHANGLETLYSHNKKNLVKVGDWVHAGQLIALVGRTGRATTEHLHFEVRCNGKPFNSDKLFDHQSHRLRRELFVFRKNGGSVSISAAKHK